MTASHHERGLDLGDLQPLVYTRYRPEGSGVLRGTCPPVAWRQRRPVRRSTPTASQAACSVEPPAMIYQNRAYFSISSFFYHIHNTSHR